MTGAAVRLPAGRHGLPRELVVENQRARLLIASAEVLAERGYARLTVEAILRRARISKRTFYQQFSGLWDCLADAYATAGAGLCEEISRACAGNGSAGDGDGDDRPGRLSGGVEVALAWAAANPDFARMLSGAPPPAVEPLRSARLELTEQLTSFLRAARDVDSDSALLPTLEERLVDAAISLVAARLVSGSAEELPQLAPELTELLLR